MSHIFSLTAMLALTLMNSAAAQGSAVSGLADPQGQKIDTLLQRQQQMLEGQQQLLREVLPLDMFPNGARSFILNLPLALVGSANSATILSASASWFPPHSQLEFVLPVYLRDDHGDEEFRGLLADVQGRLYMNPRRAGLYVVGGLRSAWLTGRENDGWEWDPQTGQGIEISGEEHRLHKMGFYGGAGWRASSSRFYWNMNLVMGRYVGQTGPELNNEGLMGGKLLLDAEFFKFGFIF